MLFCFSFYFIYVLAGCWGIVCFLISQSVVVLGMGWGVEGGGWMPCQKRAIVDDAGCHCLIVIICYTQSAPSFPTAINQLL